MRDFLDRQQHAESRTGYLVFLLTVATILTVVLTGLVIGYVAVLSAYVISRFGDSLPLLSIFGIAFVAATCFARTHHRSGSRTSRVISSAVVGKP